MSATPKALIENLHRECGEVINKSLAGEREAQLASRYVFLDQLKAWDLTLTGRAELRLFTTAQAEYTGAILSACQGRYRSAFKSLRLCLELYLQGLLLSVDELAMVEWLGNQKDTVWALIVDTERGVFSARYVRAFFAELDERRKSMETLSRTMYRELSECTHGNIPQLISIPPEVIFSQQCYDTFLAKCDTLRLIIHFSLSVRYIRGMSSEKLAILEGMLLEELGHLAPIRAVFGGVVDGNE